jgi:hypothetical protein
MEAGDDREANLLIELARTPVGKQVLRREARKMNWHARGRVGGHPCSAAPERVAVRADADVLRLVADGGA